MGKPAKCTITMGVKVTRTDYTGEVSNMDMLNASLAILRDAQAFSGMAYKEIFAILDDGLDAGVFKKNPTMNASKSDEVAE